ncbi:MAG: hypothetical protein U1E46_08910 [Hyphomicrobiales bacterium]
MLIIATPKSASSSFAASLAEATATTVTNRVVRDRLRCCPTTNDFPLIAAIHGENFELDRAASDILLSIDGVKKHHVPPTPNNLAVLRDVPKVVLTRSAGDVVDAYWRGFETGVWTFGHAVMEGARSLEQWRQVARERGLPDEIERFNESWRNAPGNALLLDFDEVVAEGPAAVSKASRYFGVASGPVSHLAREKFTRTRGVDALSVFGRVLRRSHQRVRTAYRSLARA